MPQYKVTDPSSGRSFVLTGDAPPTEDVLKDVFSHGVRINNQYALCNF